MNIDWKLAQYWQNPRSANIGSIYIDSYLVNVQATFFEFSDIEQYFLANFFIFG